MPTCLRSRNQSPVFTPVSAPIALKSLAISVVLFWKYGMRLEATAREDGFKIWMTDGELNELRRAAANPFLFLTRR